MKPEGHKRKAEAFESRARRWESETEAPSVIEDIFDAIVHYIAAGINIKYGRDIDSHQAQKRFLKEHGENEIYDIYNNIESIRIASVYGGAWNGDRIKKAMKYLEDVKAWLETSGKKI